MCWINRQDNLALFQNKIPLKVLLVNTRLTTFYSLIIYNHPIQYQYFNVNSVSIFNIDISVSISMFQYINISIFQYFNISIFQCLNVSIFQYFSISILNISMFQYINISVYQYINIQFSIFNYFNINTNISISIFQYFNINTRYQYSNISMSLSLILNNQVLPGESIKTPGV